MKGAKTPAAIANLMPAATRGWVGAAFRKKIAANEIAMMATTRAMPTQRASVCSESCSWLCSWALITVLLSASVLQFGCKSKARDPEAEVKETVAQLETWVEGRKLRSIKERLSSDYRDADGRRKADLVAFLQLQFLRRRSIGVLTAIHELRIENNNAAQVVVLAAAGSRVGDDLASLGGLTGNVFSVQIGLRWDGDEWLVESLDWRRARKSDLVELLEGGGDD
jgi:hypothetical protein